MSIDLRKAVEAGEDDLRSMCGVDDICQFTYDDIAETVLRAALPHIWSWLQTKAEEAKR